MKRSLLPLSLFALCSACHLVPVPWRLAPRHVPAIVPPIAVNPWRPFYTPQPVHLPRVYHPRPGFAYYPWHYRYRSIVEASADQPTQLAPYVAPRTLAMKFGDPTIGTTDDIRGEWRIDAQRSAAVMGAWLRHVLRAHGSDETPDVTELENDFRTLDARLTIDADGTYSMALRTKDSGERMQWRGGWQFREGVLSLDHQEDVDGVPIEDEGAYRFHYYANERFTGLVVVDHGLGIVLRRS